jgi:hypothetical protein
VYRESTRAARRRRRGLRRAGSASKRHADAARHGVTGPPPDGAFVELFRSFGNITALLIEWKASWPNSAAMVNVNFGIDAFFADACAHAVARGDNTFAVYGQGPRVDREALFAALDECTES